MHLCIVVCIILRAVRKRTWRKSDQPKNTLCSIARIHVHQIRFTIALPSRYSVLLCGSSSEDGKKLRSTRCVCHSGLRLLELRPFLSIALIVRDRLYIHYCHCVFKCASLLTSIKGDVASHLRDPAPKASVECPGSFANGGCATNEPVRPTDPASTATHAAMYLFIAIMCTVWV